MSGRHAGCGWTIAAALVLVLPDPAGAEVFVLAGGGRIEGQWLNPDELPRTKYVIQTPAGTRVTLDPSQVQRVVRLDPAEQEYEETAHTFPDTPDGQWRLAQWCLDRNLPVQRKIHLSRVLRLEPDHAEARRLLGYVKHHGRWLTQEEANRAQGLVSHKGRWITPQERDTLEAKDRAAKAEKEWMSKIERWRNQLLTDRDRLAREDFASIKDPAAARALQNALRKEDRPQACKVLIDALGRIDTAETQRILARTALDDPNESIRLACLEQLSNHKDPATVGYFIAQLKDRDNQVVVRSAVALSHLKDASAVRPLIEALVTTHKVTPKPAASPTGVAYPAIPGRNLLQRDSLLAPVKQEIRNQAVLEALIVLTGANFQYDKRAWYDWLSANAGDHHVGTRRD